MRALRRASAGCARRARRCGRAGHARGAGSSGRRASPGGVLVIVIVVVIVARARGACDRAGAAPPVTDPQPQVAHISPPPWSSGAARSPPPIPDPCSHRRSGRTGRSSTTSAPQARQRPRPGTSTISRSRLGQRRALPDASSKQKRTASGSTADSLPISSTIRRTRAPPPGVRSAMSTISSTSAISCMAALPGPGPHQVLDQRHRGPHRGRHRRAEPADDGVGVVSLAGEDRGLAAHQPQPAELGAERRAPAPARARDPGVGLERPASTPLAPRARSRTGCRGPARAGAASTRMAASQGSARAQARSKPRMPKSTTRTPGGWRPRRDHPGHLAAEAVVSQEDVADAGHEHAGAHSRSWRGSPSINTTS